MPNLFLKDELASVLDDIRPAAKKAGVVDTQDQLYAFLLERVRSNLHVVLCMSPIGEAFRERCRMFPGNYLTEMLPPQPACFNTLPRYCILLLYSILRRRSIGM